MDEPETKAEPLTTHHLGMLNEMFQRNFQLIIEWMTGMEERLTRRWEDRFANIDVHLDLLELAVRRNSEDLQKNSADLRKNSEELRKNSEELRQLKRQVVALRKRISNLERNTAQLNVEVGAVRERVSNLEREIARLERRVGAIEAHLGVTAPA